MKRLVSYSSAAIAAFAVLLAATPSRATVTLTLGNNPQPGQENVLLNQGETGSTVTGETNQSNTTVNFTSTVDTLLIPSAGQALIRGEPEEDGINEITITVPGFTFTGLIFNPAITAQIGTIGALATVSALVNEPGGGTSTFNDSYTLGQGNNFATLVASNGETIRSVTISLPIGDNPPETREFFHDLQQVRVSGLAPIPEPMSLIVWSTLGLLGLTIAWWRKSIRQ